MKICIVDQQCVTIELKSEPSFAGIHRVFKVIWLFEDKFQDRNFLATLNFGVSNLSKNCSLS